MSQIKISNLTFAYEGSYDNIFENVSFVIDTDWKLGFTGRNGRGKTTFLNLLLEKYTYEGTIQADVGFEYFPYEIKDKDLLSINIVDEICPEYNFWELEREFNRLALDTDVLYRPYSTLSNGEQTKLLLAAMFLKENSFLLIDEPTNHLDIEGRELVARYLNSKTGFILVSHDRAFLDDCVDHILSINKTNIEIVQGDFSSWHYNKELKDRFEIEKNLKLKKEIKRLTETAREKAVWSDRKEATKIGTHCGNRGRIGHLAAKMMKRSKAIELRRDREIEEKKKLLKDVEESEALKLHPLEYRTNKLVELYKVSLAYGEREIFKDMSFTIEQGDRIAIRGRNGSGKSSIIKLIMGENSAYSGKILKSNDLKISYINQDTSDLSGKLEDYIIKYGIDGVLFRAILRKLDFSRIQFEKDMSAYSAGQKKKVLIARSLCEHAHLYIWDEPLNYVDVLSRMQIEDLLLEYAPTLLFVEHDKMFCENIANKEIYL